MRTKTPAEAARLLVPSRAAQDRGVVGAKRQGGGPYEALQELPEQVVGEIIGGRLYTQPRPSFDHAGVSSALISTLFGPFQRGSEGPGGWILLFEPELHLGKDPNVLVPDLAGWRRTRMPERPTVAATSLAPDWICEVLSPSTAIKDREKKLPIYAHEGVAHAWLIDPDAKSLEIFRLHSGVWTLVARHGEDACVRAEPFDAIELELAVLWAR